MGDSKEQNGSYKIELARPKKDFFLNCDCSLTHLNWHLLISYPLSTRHGMLLLQVLIVIRRLLPREVGFPCNRNLILNKEMQHTMTKDDTALFQSMERNFIPPTAMTLHM